MKILHIITSLGDGGAENTLYKICKHDTGNNHFVISLKKPKKYSKKLRKINIKIYHLNINYFSFFSFLKLIYLIRLIKPNIIQTWLIHGDLLGGIAAKLSGFNNIIWNIRYSNLEVKKENFINILLIKLLAYFSYFIPKKIIVVSKSAKINCKNFGYDKKRIILINNGYDLSIYKSSQKDKLILRRKFKIKKHIPIIGNVARFVPMKDHMNLISSLSILKQKNINFFCLLAGSNVDNKNLKLIHHIKELKLSNQIKLLGIQKNISKIMNSLDVYIQSSSYGEGFPNVVAEAMAHEIPCIVTNVGDAKYIVGQTGWTVPPKNPLKLALAIKNVLLKVHTKEWKYICKQSRTRVKKNFNIRNMILSYSKLWLNVYNQSKK